jgi:hypothetical protein
MSDRKRALICFPHGIGDIIQATSAMKALYDEDYVLDMMVRPSVIDSHLLDDCPYIGKLIKVRTDTTEQGWEIYHKPHFSKIKSEYDRAILCSLLVAYKHRQVRIAEEFGVNPPSYKPDVWINQQSILEAQKFIHENVPDGRFIHVHTKTEVHKKYWWESFAYVRKKYPDIPILDSGYAGNLHKRFANINTTFAIMRLAAHRVLSISVMAAAAEALDLPIDLLNCVHKDHACLPMNRGIIKQYRIAGKIE